MKIHPVGAELRHADGYRHDEARSRFSKSAYKCNIRAELLLSLFRLLPQHSAEGIGKN